MASPRSTPADSSASRSAPSRRLHSLKGTSANLVEDAHASDVPVHARSCNEGVPRTHRGLPPLRASGRERVRRARMRFTEGQQEGVFATPAFIARTFRQECISVAQAVQGRCSLQVGLDLYHLARRVRNQAAVSIRTGDRSNDCRPAFSAQIAGAMRATASAGSPTERHTRSAWAPTAT